MRADEAVMIGNSLETDIRGALEAGITTVWMNRDKEKSQSTVKSDYEISSMSQLDSILDDLG
jgi:FMN phosphatase YigB (HAD superfamily)